MQVSVAPGTAAVALASAAGSALCRWDAAEIVTLTAAPPSGSSRIDLVVLQVRDNTLDAGGNNDFIFQAIAGAGGTPGPGAVPAVPTNAYAVAQLTIPGGAANLNGVTVVDRRVPMAGAARAYRNAAWTTASASPTTVLLDTASYGTGFNLGTGLYTCPVAGLYLATGQLVINSSAAGQSVRASLLWNGALYTVAPANYVTTAASQITGGVVSDLVLAAAGDTIGLATFGAPAGATGVTGALNTMLAVRYLG
jgi:hypothetical protein